MSASKEYEEAKAAAVAEVVLSYRQAMARAIAREVFGGSPEQQEETYQKLMEYEAPSNN